MKRLAILVGLLVLLYLNTALIPGALVIRPFHGLFPFYSEGGEDGTWQRHDPGAPEPWWLMRQGCVSVISFEEEFAAPPIVVVYALGYWLTVVGVAGLAGYYAYRRLRPRPPRPESQPSRMTPAPRVWVLSLMIAIAAPGWGAPPDPLDAEVAMAESYSTFEEALAQLEQATDMKIVCPADTARAMHGLLRRPRASEQVREIAFGLPSREEHVKERRSVRALLDFVCRDLGLVWKFQVPERTVQIDVAWRTEDARSAAELLQAVWQPGLEKEATGKKAWWHALDALMSKEENFATACRVRQRATLASLLRQIGIERWQESRSTVTQAYAVSDSGTRYRCLFMVHPMETSPGHGWMDYYCFDEAGALKIGDVMNTGHRQQVERVIVNQRGPDAPGASEIRMMLHHNGGGASRSACFVLREGGLALVDESGAGESLLEPANAAR